MKFDKFKNVKLEQSENILSNESIWEVSKCNILRDLSDSHPSNI